MKPIQRATYWINLLPLPQRGYSTVVWLATLAILVAICLVPLDNAQAAGSSPIAIPSNGYAYYGVQLSWDVDTPAAYASRLGKTPVVYGDFVAFPLNNTDKLRISQEVDQIATVHGKLMLTVEPMGGLNTVTSTAIRDLVTMLANDNARGVDVFVRFAQEMNGSWYPWGQQPTAYVSAFRNVAKAVHQLSALQTDAAGGHPMLRSHSV